VEQLSGMALPLETGMLSSLLGRYAELLATQGSLNSAATYLVDPNERTLAILRDRIYQALGHRSPQFPFQRVDIRRSSSVSSTQQMPQQHNAPNVQPTRKTSFPYQSTPQQFPYGSTASSVANSFTYSNATVSAPYQQPLPPLVTPQSMNQVPSSLSPAMPPASVPPPPDASQPVKSMSGSHHLTHRYPRHLHDPSVYTENNFSNQSFYQPQAFNPPQPPAETLPPVQPSTNYYAPSPADMNACNALQYPSNAANAASFPATPYSAPSSQAPSSFNSAPAPVQPLPSCYSEVQPGWNDPPFLKQSSVKNTNYEPMAPITSPFPDAPMAPQPTPPVPQAGGYFVPSFQSQQPPGPAPVMGGNNPQMPPQMPEQPKITQNIPEQPKEKGPIPPEHQVLQDIFEDLRRQCQQVATNPQMRRKLDDVAKKLENLYDKLRDNSLSNPVTNGLHQIVQAIMQSDYATALSIHGQLVQNATFSEISGFMPSIKVLLQTAAQLNVFLQ
jgi:protein transport protein SEC31